MATSGTLYTGYSRSTRFYLKWSEKSQSTSRNSTTINWSVWLDNGNDWYTNAIKINSVYINGTKVMSSKTFSGFYDNKDYELGSGTLTIAHKDDGTKTFSCSLSGWTYNGDTLTKSGSFTLDKINRYLDSFSNSIGSTALESFNIKWTCSPARDYTQYSLNGGSWTNAGDTVASDNKSGNYTVSGRSPNTTYTIKTRLRRKDSGLYSECSQLSPKTKDYSRISNVTQLTLPAPGSGATLNYSLTKASTNTTNTYLQRNGEGSGSYKVSSNNVSAGNNKFTLSADVINTIYSQHNTVTAAYNGDANKRATSGISVVAQTIGSKSYYHTYNTTFIMTKNNCGPTAIKDFTCKETNSAIAALTGCTGTYTNGDGLILINGFSGIRFDVPANPLTVRASANNKSVSIAGSSALTSTSATNYTINHATKNSYSITASDSRNFSLTKSTTGLKLINYTPVNITKLQIDRSGGIGTTAVINFHGNFNNIYFGAVTNTIKKILLKIKTKNLSWNSSSINGGTTIDNSKVNIYDITSFAGIFGPDFDCKNKTITTANGENVIFPLGKEYDISLVVYDELSNIEEFNSSSAVQYDSIDSGKVLMSAVKNEGVCFGGFYDSEIGGPLQVGTENQLNVESYLKNFDILKTDFNEIKNDDLKRFNGIVVTTANTNLNDYKNPGTYFFNSSAKPINIPAGVNGWLQVMKYNDTWIKQVWYRAGTVNSNDFQTFVRTQANGTWSDWHQFVLTDNMASLMTQKVLANPIAFMNGSQRFYFSERASEQRNGIILLFCGYANNEVQNYNYTAYFVPKQVITDRSGAGHFIPLGGTSGISGCKYIYINDDNVKGHANNSKATMTTNGVTYNNDKFVLRTIYGV